MSSPDLLREALRELLYGPDGLHGLFSERGSGLLHTLHVFSYRQAITPSALGRATPAQTVMHLRHALELGAAQLADPFALLTDTTDPWTWVPAGETAWRAELVNLARAGQALYDALYIPLTGETSRIAYGAVIHAATQAGALRFHLLNLQVG